MAGWPTDATPEEASKVWDSMKTPSVRRVAEALTASGKKVSKSAVQKWKDNGWTAKPNPVPLPDPVAELDAAVPAITGDPMKRLEAITPPTIIGRGPMDDEAADQFSRALAVMGASLAEHARNLVLEKPATTGDMLIKIGTGLNQLAAYRTQNDARNVTGAVDVTPSKATARGAELLADSIAVWTREANAGK